MSQISIEPIDQERPDFGATIRNVDLENLTDQDFATLRDALYRYSVICIKTTKELPPKVQADLTRRFDPEATGSYGHGKTIDAKRSILHPDLKTIPSEPSVQVIGNGHIASYHGLSDITLKHPHHRTFHKTAVPLDQDHECTRFYRWHIDAALHGALHPPPVTSLLAVSLPAKRTQTLLYDDGTGDTLPVPLGTTAFTSGYTTFDLLSPAQRRLALTARVEYAAHPYVWISSAKSHPTGLGMVSDGLELSADQLPPSCPHDVQTLPMAWRNPVTGRYALQIHPSVVRRVHLADGTVVDDLAAARRLVYDLLRPGIAPARVYAHDWAEGDLVLFNNHGVLHSVVGAFAPGEVRLFRQCNMAGSRPPVGPTEDVIRTAMEEGQAADAGATAAAAAVAVNATAEVSA